MSGATASERTFAICTLADGAERRNVYWRAFSNGPYGLHREVWRLLARGEESTITRADVPHVWRFELVKGQPRLILLAKRVPEDPESLWRIQSRPWEPRLRTGASLRFCGRLNPTTSKDGRRLDLVPARRRAGDLRPIPELVTEWLERELTKAGATLTGLDVESHSIARVIDGGARFGTSEVSGQLRVEDPSRFLERHARGFGGARAFGCGLLLLRRAESS